MRCNVFYIFSFLLLLCCSNGKVIAQYHNVWAFGYHVGIDFNTSPPTAFETALGWATYEAGASVCDKEGRLLFYTEGDKVYDRNNNIMPNGRAIGRGYTVSSAQGTAIVPMPGNEDKYYIFSMLSWETGRSIGTLLYSIVDMTKNDGLGSVITERPIQMDNFLTEHMTTVPGNNCDVWLLTVNRKDNSFKAYNINEKGIDTLPVISPGFITKELTTKDEMIGHMAISPDGKKLAIMQDRALLYDFDAYTGKVSKPVVMYTIPREWQDADDLYGTCFSPDNSKLYYAIRRGNDMGTYQYDISSGDSAAIIHSKTLLSERAVAAMQRAPDGKIYAAPGGALTVIHYPNLSGKACNLVHDDFALIPGTGSIFGIPNIISIAGQNDEPVINSTNINVCFQSSTMLNTSRDDSRNHLWSTGDTGKKITVNLSGIYWVQYKSSCLTYIDTFHVDIFNPNVITQPSCFNQDTGEAYLAFDLPVDYGYRAYWMNANLDTLSVTDRLSLIPAGSYTVHIVSERGCYKIIPFSIGRLDHRVAFSPSDSIICAGDAVTFLNRSHSYFTSFYWQLDTGNVSSETNPVHAFDRPGVYAIMLAAAGERCRDTAYGTIITDAAWGLLTFEADKQEICIGEAIHLIPNVGEDTTLLSLLWQTGDSNTFTSNDKMITHAYATDGIMWLRLTARFRACPDISASDTITVHAMPVVDLGADSVICLKGTALTLENRHPGEEGFSYLWSTGAVTRNIQVAHEGEFRVQVSNAFGCTAQRHIIVNKDCYVDIPNAFTPDGDGVNDYFFPRQLLGNGVKGFRMQVYSRWGQKVFETTNTEGRGWDGKFNRQEQLAGVYVYIIEIKMINGKVEKYEGNVSLIR